VASIMDHVGVSATGGLTKRPLDEVLPIYSAMGYRYFEAWLQGRGSALDPSRGAEPYLQTARRHGMAFCSLHMRTVESADDEAVAKAREEAFFAEALGVRVVTYTAATKELYVESMKRFLDAVEGHWITPVIQVHEGRALETMDDLTDVLEAVDDERLMVQHEVGSFHALGTSWKEAVDRFGKRIGLVHVKDMIGSQSVPLGQGEVDIPGLFAAMRKLDYDGFFVIEIANVDQENTERYFAEAAELIRTQCQ
jgi:sugar phosphate isomerase/epimerase